MTDNTLSLLAPVMLAAIGAIVIVAVVWALRRRRGRLQAKAGNTSVSFTSAAPRKIGPHEIVSDDSDVRGNRFRVVKDARVGIFSSVFRRNRVEVYDPGDGGANQGGGK